MAQNTVSLRRSRSHGSLYPRKPACVHTFSGDETFRQVRAKKMPLSGNLPWEGLPAGQQGNSPAPGGGGRSAWLPPGPSESPPTAASRWLFLPPEIPPWPGSAVNKNHTQ